MPNSKKTTKSKTKNKKKSPKEVVYRKLPNVWDILLSSLKILKKYWKIFTYITLIYAILYIVFVRGVSGGLNLNSIKTSLDQTKTSTSLSTGFSMFTYLIGNSTSSASTNVNAGVYQTILLIIMSLAVIWCLRQSYNNVIFRVRDSFYKGMYPLIQFILILLVIGLELIPLLIGSALYSQVTTSGIAASGFEKVLWLIIFLALSLVSLYMITSTVFALYIATLPDMTPFKAMRSARQLVRRRRWVVLRKLLFLPLVLLIVAVIIMIPAILLITSAASWIFLIISLLSLVFIHSYIYSLYRELINE